jgi:hypothetical protein
MCIPRTTATRKSKDVLHSYSQRYFGNKIFALLGYCTRQWVFVSQSSEMVKRPQLQGSDIHQVGVWSLKSNISLERIFQLCRFDGLKTHVTYLCPPLYKTGGFHYKREKRKIKQKVKFLIIKRKLFCLELSPNNSTARLKYLCCGYFRTTKWCAVYENYVLSCNLDAIQINQM